jgi:uncharacterized membrane protein YvbJ
MQQSYQCPRCGVSVPFGFRFCGNCGTQLNWQQQTPNPPVYQGQQQRRDEGNWFTFHKENVIALAIGLAFIAVGLGLFYFGLLGFLGIVPLPILGVLIIIFALYRIIRGQKGN